jgi:hypothetical protein
MCCSLQSLDAHISFIQIWGPIIFCVFAKTNNEVNLPTQHNLSIFGAVANEEAICFLGDERHPLQFFFVVVSLLAFHQFYCHIQAILSTL